MRFVFIVVTNFDSLLSAIEIHRGIIVAFTAWLGEFIGHHLDALPFLLLIAKKNNFHREHDIFSFRFKLNFSGSTINSEN